MTTACTGAFITGLLAGLTAKHWYPKLEHLEAQSYVAGRWLIRAWKEHTS